MNTITCPSRIHRAVGISCAPRPDGLDAFGYTDAFTYELGFRGDPKYVARSRDLTPADFVRNAREI